jgi:hypothetical protein
MSGLQVFCLARPAVTPHHGGLLLRKPKLPMTFIQAIQAQQCRFANSPA